MRRALIAAALALLLVLDLSVVPLALAIMLPGGGSAHGAHLVGAVFYFLLVVSVLAWLTVSVVTRLRRLTPEPGAGRR